MFDNQQETPLL